MRTRHDEFYEWRVFVQSFVNHFFQSRNHLPIPIGRGSNYFPSRTNVKQTWTGNFTLTLLFFDQIFVELSKIAVRCALAVWAFNSILLTNWDQFGLFFLAVSSCYQRRNGGIFSCPFPTWKVGQRKKGKIEQAYLWNTIGNAHCSGAWTRLVVGCWGEQITRA